MTTRPMVGPTGKLLAGQKPRRLWVIRRRVPQVICYEPNLNAGCLIVYFRVESNRWGPLDLATAWRWLDRDSAEEVAATQIMMRPDLMMGNVEIVEVVG